MDLIRLRKYIQSRKIREKINICKKYFIPLIEHELFITDDYVGFKCKGSETEFCSFNLIAWKGDKFYDEFHGIHFRINAFQFYKTRKIKNEEFLALLDHSNNYLKAVYEKSEYLYKELTLNDKKYGKLFKLIDNKL